MLVLVLNFSSISAKYYEMLANTGRAPGRVVVIFQLEIQVKCTKNTVFRVFSSISVFSEVLFLQCKKGCKPSIFGVFCPIHRVR